MSRSPFVRSQAETNMVLLSNDVGGIAWSPRYLGGRHTEIDGHWEYSISVGPSDLTIDMPGRPIRTRDGRLYVAGRSMQWTKAVAFIRSKLSV